MVINQTVNSSSSSAGSTSNTGSSSTGTATPTATVSGPVSTLWVIDASTGSYHELLRSGGTTPLTLRSVQGDTIFFSQKGEPVPPNTTTSIWEAVYKASATQAFAIQTVLSGSQFVDYVLAPRSGNAFNRVTKTLWCTPATPINSTSYEVGCANGTLTAIDASTGNATGMGTLTPPSASTIKFAHLFGLHDIWQNRNGVLALMRAQDPSHYTGDLYLVNPDTGNSLKRITPLP